MTDIEQKALALIKPGASCEVNFENISILATALTCAIEQHEAFRQEVSDALKTFKDGNRHTMRDYLLEPFIITKPDPLVEILDKATDNSVTLQELADHIRAALEAREAAQ